MTASRLEFSDKQKAEIFVRDKALCAFSGKSLWMLDYGASPTYAVDWVDHILPASKGGDNSMDNGICASYFYNAKKRDNENDNQYFFFAGKPTKHFYFFNEVIPDQIADHLKRFQWLDSSDWYFNRGIFRTLLGAWRIHDRNNGFVYKRDDEYYANSASKILIKWHKLVRKGLIESFEERGIVDNNYSEDIKILLSLRDHNSPAQVLEVIQEVYPFFRENFKVLDRLSNSQSSNNYIEVEAMLKESQFVTPRIKNAVTRNLKILKNIRSE